MAKVTDNTWVVDPRTGAPKALLKGDDVPAWADGQVGEHLLEGGADAGPTPYKEQSAKDLEAAIAERNAGREEADRIVPQGTGANGRVVKDDLVAALEADDAAQPDGDDGDDE